MTKNKLSPAIGEYFMNIIDLRVGEIHDLFLIWKKKKLVQQYNWMISFCVGNQYT